jgi:hypothetical protein
MRGSGREDPAGSLRRPSRRRPRGARGLTRVAPIDTGAQDAPLRPRLECALVRARRSCGPPCRRRPSARDRRRGASRRRGCPAWRRGRRRWRLPGAGSQGPRRYTTAGGPEIAKRSGYPAFRPTAPPAQRALILHPSSRARPRSALASAPPMTSLQARSPGVPTSSSDEGQPPGPRSGQIAQGVGIPRLIPSSARAPLRKLPSAVATAWDPLAPQSRQRVPRGVAHRAVGVWEAP